MIPLPDPAKKRYDRLAFFYNTLEAPFEYFRFSFWRERLRRTIVGCRALEAGVGTGKNLVHYPSETKITAIDLSPAMLKRARKTAAQKDISVTLLEMDVQKIEFPDNYFDTVFATFVFCSVFDPVAGLKELRRVCKPGGKLLLLEHIRPRKTIMGFVFDFLNPIIVRMMGANINLRTLDNIRIAGWRIRSKEMLWSDIVWWIEADNM